MLACALFNEQNKGPILLSIIMSFVLGKQNVHAKNGLFTEKANKFHSTIKLTAEISENEITFLDTVVFKGERLKKEFSF